jgi:hypothetical protein
LIRIYQKAAKSSCIPPKALYLKGKWVKGACHDEESFVFDMGMVADAGDRVGGRIGG